jgi:spore coat protein U-like protein
LDVRFKILLLALGLCGSAAPALADNATATIAVSVSVLPACAVSGAPVAFGTYVPMSTANQNSNVSLTCSPGVNYAVALDEGTQGDGSTRRMARGDGATIAYDLYRDAAHQQRWASGGAAATGTGSGGVQSFPVYARILPTSAPAGTYSDNVTIVVSY